MGRWFPLILALLLRGLIFTVGFLFGCRITYAPELENSWEAISAVASWAGVVVSAVAAWAAVQIPKKIAEQQEKVELYTRRLEFYNTLDACGRFLKSIEKNEESGLSELEIRRLFVVKFGFGKSPGENLEENFESGNPIFHRTMVLLQSGEFLFRFEVKKYTQNIKETLSNLLNAKKESEIHERLLKYKDAVNEVQKNLISQVEDTLKL